MSEDFGEDEVGDDFREDEVGDDRGPDDSADDDVTIPAGLSGSGFTNVSIDFAPGMGPPMMDPPMPARASPAREAQT